MKRIQTIDYLKGISIIVIIYIHFMMAWVTPDWSSFQAFAWMVVDSFGGSMFIFLSCLGKMISVRQQGDDKVFSMQTVTRSTFLMIVGIVIWLSDGISPHGIQPPWNIIFVLGLMQIFTPWVMKRPKVARVVFVATIYITFFPLISLDLIPYGTIIYSLFMDFSLMNPIFTWMMIPLVTTIVFEDFVKNDDQGPGKVKKIFISGLILVAIAIATSSLITYVVDFHDELQWVRWLWHDDPFKIWYLDGIPSFLVRDYPQYIFFVLGMDLLLFSLFYRVEVARPYKVKKVINLGRLSLTGYGLSGLGFWIPLKLSCLAYHVIIIVVVFVIINGLWAWTTKLKEYGTLEFLLMVYSKMFVLISRSWTQEKVLMITRRTTMKQDVQKREK
ncbi:MAG TPA: heparan-alpha-glucosaminide N-acetyltransferase domain-containing protein [Candidatus Lokiarchaeia archaeon]|nr:heparan-alpha-glucosaminide N-acetyltransferase domain-containing protein [Candidatus Lokiarchaeia archaeon]